MKDWFHAGRGRRSSNVPPPGSHDQKRHDEQTYSDAAPGGSRCHRAASAPSFGPCRCRPSRCRLPRLWLLGGAVADQRRKRRKGGRHAVVPVTAGRWSGCEGPHRGWRRLFVSRAANRRLAGSYDELLVMRTCTGPHGAKAGRWNRGRARTDSEWSAAGVSLALRVTAAGRRVAAYACVGGCSPCSRWAAGRWGERVGEGAPGEEERPKEDYA